MALLRALTRLRVYRSGQPLQLALNADTALRDKLIKFPSRSLPVFCCSTLASSSDISVQYKHGRPVLELPLPSRQEKCVFFLRPVCWTVSDFIHEIQKEDPGVSTAAVLTKDGVNVASSTPMETLLDKNFQLCLNELTYNILAVPAESAPDENTKAAAEVKNIVHMLHTALNLPEHHLRKEKLLLQKLDFLKQELMPLEQMKVQLDMRAERSSSQTLWAGLALLSVQGGALAWLTWWVYSWDIMEPVTYFITYSTSIGIYGYYVLTKQDYVYPDAKDRQFLHYFYKGVQKQKFNVQKYNMLKDKEALLEEDLRRLRNPNQLQLPVEQIQTNRHDALP